MVQSALRVIKPEAREFGPGGDTARPLAFEILSE